MDVVVPGLTVTYGASGQMVAAAPNGLTASPAPTVPLTADERIAAAAAALAAVDAIAAPVLPVDVLDVLAAVRTALEGS